jgi:hypothetical protein
MQAAQQTVTALERIHTEWLTRGGQRPAKKALRGTVQAYERIRSEREELEKRLSELKEQEHTVATNIVAQCGKGRFVINGRTYQATSRGEVIFLKQYPAATEL